MIRFPCSCGQPYDVPEDRAGSSFQCMRCGKLVDVPALSDLEHLAADGTYGLDDKPLEPPDAATLESMMLAFSRGKVDIYGHEKDLRNTQADFAGLGEPEMLEFADEAPDYRRAVAPKYDPVTGELIRPMEVKETKRAADADAVPVAKAMIAYARRRHGEAPFRAAQIIPAMFAAPNLIVVLVIFIAHVGLQLLMIPVMAGLFLLVPAMIIFAMLFPSHYAVVVNDIATEEKDELPRPLRDFSWHDDLWGPFVHFAMAAFLAYGPLIAINWLPNSGVLVSTYVLAVLAWGTCVFPALFLTTTTSGHWLNLSPDRVIRVIGSLGIKYVLCVVLWATAIVSYLAGIGGTMYALISLMVTPGSMPLNPWMVTAFAYPLLVVGILLMHIFCWYLGLQYRQHQPQFRWAFQSHDKGPPTEQQGFFVGASADTPAARRARLGAQKPVRAIPVPPQQQQPPPR